MKKIWKFVSWLGLGLTLVPSLLLYAGALTDQQNKQLMFLGVILWFATAPLWMRPRPQSEDIFEL